MIVERALLENFILKSKSTNAEHQEALGWLNSIAKKYNQLEQKLNEEKDEG